MNPTLWIHRLIRSDGTITDSKPYPIKEKHTGICFASMSQWTYRRMYKDPGARIVHLVSTGDGNWHEPNTT